MGGHTQDPEKVLYKWNEYTAEDCTKTTKTLTQHKNKRAPEGSDMEFSFHDLDIGWDFKTSDKALKNIVKQKQSGTGASASTDIPPPPAPVPIKGKAPALALEDAKERDKIMLKLEEALKNAPHLILKARKVAVALPDNTMGKDQRKKVETQKESIDKWIAQLEHVSLYNSLPGETETIEVDKLKDMLKEFHGEFELMQNLVKMASVLIKK